MPGVQNTPLEMSEEERRKARAAKFGLPNDAAEKDKLKARAAKFGLPDPAVSPSRFL